ncbi:S-adenosyl-L-methionine dependent methyltransferase [Roridomyces roridus]|uniref:S-adenosyl-L-methionine dependent methyltransferase n=1 Tax=Roridomyces roridus TaxID=1738132 RepID=A0AAD7BZ46_9AGAR|nr:S-adenosyl-L-methionine dependent methyltransferase [Roridomyces roridus]
MHPRNPYRAPPDFRELAKAYSPLQPCLLDVPGGGASINFKDELSQRRLTEALLHRDFGLSLELPENRLCPPVPNRLNYVLWIQDILRASFGRRVGRVVGVDVGTGASAIYPLLSCKLDADWSFIATDVDEVSLRYARSNVERNGLGDRIQILATTAEAPIFAALRDRRVDFTMCNPPFYSSHQEVAASAEAKEFEPNAVCTGADVEMITPGGESAFVRRMVEESVELGERCCWYTSMLGKLSSVTEVVAAFREREIENYGITEFIQGSTRRWAVVWSFSDLRLPDSTARITTPKLQSLMPPRNTLVQSFPSSGQRVEALNDVLHGVLESVDGARVASSEVDIPFIITATKNTWSRGARRKNKNNPDPEVVLEEESEPAVICALRWTESSTEICLECQWVQGRDRSLFEGLSSHISRKVAAILNSSN